MPGLTPLSDFRSDAADTFAAIATLARKHPADARRLRDEFWRRAMRQIVAGRTPARAYAELALRADEIAIGGAS